MSQQHLTSARIDSVFGGSSSTGRYLNANSTNHQYDLDGASEFDVGLRRGSSDESLASLAHIDDVVVSGNIGHVSSGITAGTGGQTIPAGITSTFPVRELSTWNRTPLFVAGNGLGGANGLVTSPSSSISSTSSSSSSSATSSSPSDAQFQLAAPPHPSQFLQVPSAFGKRTVAGSGGASVGVAARSRIGSGIVPSASSSGSSSMKPSSNSTVDIGVGGNSLMLMSDDNTTITMPPLVHENMYDTPDIRLRSLLHRNPHDDEASTIVVPSHDQDELQRSVSTASSLDSTGMQSDLEQGGMEEVIIDRMSDAYHPSQQQPSQQLRIRGPHLHHNPLSSASMDSNNSLDHHHHQQDDDQPEISASLIHHLHPVHRHHHQQQHQQPHLERGVSDGSTMSSMNFNSMSQNNDHDHHHDHRDHSLGAEGFESDTSSAKPYGSDTDVEDGHHHGNNNGSSADGLTQRGVTVPPVVKKGSSGKMLVEKSDATVNTSSTQQDNDAIIASIFCQPRIHHTLYDEDAEQSRAGQQQQQQQNNSRDYMLDASTSNLVSLDRDRRDSSSSDADDDTQSQNLEGSRLGGATTKLSSKYRKKMRIKRNLNYANSSHKKTENPTNKQLLKFKRIKKHQQQQQQQQVQMMQVQPPQQQHHRPNPSVYNMRGGYDNRSGTSATSSHGVRAFSNNSNGRSNGNGRSTHDGAASSTLLLYDPISSKAQQQQYTYSPLGGSKQSKKNGGGGSGSGRGSNGTNNKLLSLSPPSSRSKYHTTQRRDTYRLSAYSACDTYDINELIEYLETCSTFGNATLTLFGDVLHIKQKRGGAGAVNASNGGGVGGNTDPSSTTSNAALLSHRRDIYIFEYGCIVFFNYDESAEQKFLEFMEKNYATNVYKQYESEDFDFSYEIGGESHVQNDSITLSTTSSLEKLSIAFAVAQCTKLSIYEERISEEIEKNKELSQTLAITGSIPLTSDEISRKIGTIFNERNAVNLHFDILDAPELLWEEDKFKYVYDRMYVYLELGKRVEILNKRLEIMKELFDMLNDQLERKHANNLEHIVIWLILFEVLVILFWDILTKDVLGYFNHH